jgi:hypothetical protein
MEKPMLRTKGTRKTVSIQFESFEEATGKGSYDYKLTKEDVNDIARIEYNYFKNPTNSDSSRFAISSSITQFEQQIKEFQKSIHSVNRLTLILQLPDGHWATLVLSDSPHRSRGFYIDSLAISLPGPYSQILKRNNFDLHDWSQDLIQPLSPNTDQQADIYDSGLRALEYALDFNNVLNRWSSFVNDQGFEELSYWLTIRRDHNYLCASRRSLAEKLRLDSDRNLRLQQFESQKKDNSERKDDMPSRKHFKVLEKISIDARLEHFVRFIIDITRKKIAACHLIARGEPLTVEALKKELKVGATGALFGFLFNKFSIAGVVPSLVASVRSISNHYFTDKKNARKITRIFSDINFINLSQTLVESAVEIFVSYEAQFMQVTDKGGDILAMEKLAEDAVVRAFNYMAKETNLVDISVKLITKAAILGNSDRYFDPSIKKTRLSFFGHEIQDYYENKIYTANLFEKIGLVFTKDGLTQFYNKMPKENEQYGYRQVLSWEKNSQNELIDIYSQQYKRVIEPPLLPYTQPSLQRDLQNYQYTLDSNTIQTKKQAIFSNLNHNEPTEIRSEVNKKSILFDLRKPVDNFTGRSSELNAIHRALLAGRTSAVVNAMADLNSGRNIELASGTQISVSGLGGIGKTQLVLYYAYLYAAEYNNNVLWINCDTKASLFESFLKLAHKLDIKTKGEIGEDKAIEIVVEDIYEYFSNSKSLFIFDNAENYREIEFFLPKLMVGNRPHIIITSRYQNWENTASVIPLNVFTEQETLDFLKKALKIDTISQDKEIKELHRLLQGLPLALQQAIAYIKVQQLSDSFDIEAYLSLYKEESKKLLDFDFRDFINDPYLKTTYTTWQITLNKIKEIDRVGNIAIEVLESMSFMASEELHVKIFDGYYNMGDLRVALHLLREYSMISISVGSSSGGHNIHRLVQKVVNLSLQSDTTKFIRSAQRTGNILVKYESDTNIRYHYLFFLLNLLEHSNLQLQLGIYASVRKFSLLLMLCDVAVWGNFFDKIYERFSKPKYIEFLTEAYLTYRKENSLPFVEAVFEHMEKKEGEGILNKAEMLAVVDDYRTLHAKPEYKISQFSQAPEKQAQQRQLANKIRLFKKKWFPEEYGDICSKRKKRSLRCRQVQKRKQQKLALHVNRVSRVTGFVSAGLFTKDMLVDLLHGNIKSVAINAGLLLSGQISGGVADALQTSGNRLKAESVLLEKELALENKAAIHILFNEGVSAVAKKRFLGAVLKTAAPFVRRCTTVYFAYGLYKSIADYEAGDNNQLSSIISNSAIVSIDLVEMGIEGAEALELITGISAITGPIGEILGLFVWLGTEAYEVNRGLSAIEQQTTLNLYERLTESLSLLVGEGPPDYIEVRIKNNHLVQKGLSFLKKHPEIKRFVFPVEAEERDLAGSMGTSLYRSYERALQGERVVDLSRYYHLALIETMPDDPSEGRLFCADGYDLEFGFYFGNEKFDFYRCIGAVGIEYAINRSGDAMFIELGKGDDRVIAELETSTVFMIDGGSNHSKAYTGSDKNDLFVLLGDQSFGLLNGGEGIDTIDLEKFSDSNFIVLDYKATLCTEKKILDNSFSAFPVCSEHFSQLALHNINFIQGRKKKKDIFFLVGDRVAVDGRGGIDETNPDVIYVTNQVTKDLQIVLRANTLVYHQHLGSTLPFYPVHYSVLSDQHGSAQVSFPFGSELNQYFFFDHPLKNLKALTVEKARIQFNFSATPVINYPHDLFSLSLQDDKQVSTISDTTLGIPKNAYYVFKEGIELKLLDDKHVYARIEENSKLIEEYLDNFIAVANQIGKSFSIQFVNNQTALIGSEKSEVLTTDCLTESYLVGNGGENVYVLSPLNTTSFFLPEVTLYDVGLKTSFDDLRDILDLRQVVKKAKSICPSQVLSTSLSQAGNDLVLKLTTDSLFNRACQYLNTSWPIASIRFKKAFLNEWYQKVDIILEENRPMDIAYTKAKGWFLIDKPLVFDEDKEIIVLTQSELHQNAEFFLFKNRGNITFFKQNETDLIITNAWDLNTAQDDLFTIVFSQFYTLYKVREKVFSATFTFLDEDETFYLKDYEEQINTAVNFSDLLNRYPLLTPVGNRTKRAIQEAIERDTAQKWLETKSGRENNHYLGWIFGIPFSVALIVQIGNFLSRGFRGRFNEQRLLIVLGTTAVLISPVRATTVLPAIPVLPLLALRNKFSIVDQCVKSETPIGLLGICVNQLRIIYWAQVDKRQPLHFESYLVNRTENARCYLTYENSGSWLLALNQIHEVPLKEIYFQLPPSFQKRLTEQAYREHVFFIWQQQMVITASRYMGNVLTLHTPIGNLFKAVGLSPDWQARDDIHFLSRCWITTQQLLSQQTFTEKLFTFLVGLSEVALLHPRIQCFYTYLINRDFSTAKPVIRFIADLLQLGFYNFVYLARILEWCFPNSESIWKISLGLQMVNSFYSLTGDLSSWYLGMALFVLPHLPVLLEKLGIPVTRSLHSVANKLTQLFIGESILNQFLEDEERIAQQRRELLFADERIKNARNRLKDFVSSKLSFFSQNDNLYNHNPREKKVLVCSINANPV